MSYTARIRAFAAGWLMERTPQERRHLSMLLLAVALYSFHFLVWCWPQPFYIEDSAISFSYARNFMMGEGWVPFAGGERIEGFSNFLWTVLIGIFWKIGVEPWYSAKLLGYVFGVITLGLSYLIARRVRGGPLDASALVPPLLLAASTQFSLWNASGLENSLFNLFLACGIYGLIREGEEARIFPWSSLAFLGLALTRPEGIAYAAVGLLTRICMTLWQGGFSPKEGQARWRHWAALLLWVIVLAGPYAAFVAWRYDYFAWLWPNTYYAKEKPFRPFNWGGDGWPKLREYMWNYWIVWAFPALGLGAMSFSEKKRPYAVALISGLLALLSGIVLWDGKAGIPAFWQNASSRWLGAHWSDIRVYYILFIGVLVGLLSMGRKGWEARATLWACYCTALFFQIFSGGDWMKGYRWFSLASVPQFILLGVGLYSFAEFLFEVGEVTLEMRLKGRTLLERLPAKLLNTKLPYLDILAGVLVLLMMGPNVPQSYDFALDAETAVRDVHQRVRYMTGVQKKLGLDHITLLDVDMGAHLWYTNWYIMDIAGLVDVPVARHDWEKPFGKDYVIDEYRPDFAHVHGSWARTTHLTDLPEFKLDYLEIPGFPTGGRTLHVGNHVRKDLLVSSRYRGPSGREFHFGDAMEASAAPAETLPTAEAPAAEMPIETAETPAGTAPGELVLDGWEMSSPVVAPGGKLSLSTSWSGKKLKNFRVIVFFYNATGMVRSAELSAAFDWYKAERWQEGEHVKGDWAVPVPEDLPLGTWKVGLVVLEEKTGMVLPALQVVANPQYMKGELQLDQSIEVVSVEDAHTKAQQRLDQAVALAADGDCEGSSIGWRDARRHIARDIGWHEQKLPIWRTAMIHCLVNRANALSDIQEKAVPMMAAWKLDSASEEVLSVATPLGQQLEDLGDKLALAEDWEGAFRAFSASVKVDARRSWARRKAEECRDHRLKLKMKAFRWEKQIFPYTEPPAPAKPSIPVKPTVPVKPTAPTPPVPPRSPVSPGPLEPVTPPRPVVTPDAAPEQKPN